MKRLRYVGQATMATLVLVAALGASSAAGSELTAEAFPAWVAGSGASQVFSGNFGTLDCDSEIGGEVEEGATELVAEVNFSECSMWGLSPLETNGCGYTFHFGSELPNGDFKGSLDIGPAECGPMKRTVQFCTLEIGPQAGLSTRYSNVAGDPTKIAISVDATGVEYTQSGPACSKGTHQNGAYHADWVIQGYEGEQSQDIGLTNAHAPQFEAIEYPVDVSGAQDGSSPLELEFGEGSGVSFECSEATLSGALAEASSAVNLAPGYSGCLAAGFGGTTVSVNGCEWVYGAGEAAGAGLYEGSLGVSCPTGSSIDISAGFGQCQISIPAQSGLSGVEYESSYTSPYGIDAVLDVSGLTYTVTQDKILCPLKGKGTFTDGSLTGALALAGVDEEDGIYILGE